MILVAQDQGMTEARSIVGDCDMTLYQIVELLIRQREAMILHAQSTGASTTSIKPGVVQGGSMTGLAQACRLLLAKQDAAKGWTPLHHAFKTRNIELVCCILGFIK